MSAVLYGISRDQLMARHQSNHIQVAYATDAEAADRLVAAKAAMAAALGHHGAPVRRRRRGRPARRRARRRRPTRSGQRVTPSAAHRSATTRAPRQRCTTVAGHAGSKPEVPTTRR